MSQKKAMPWDRVSTIQESIRESMLRPKTEWGDVGSIWSLCEGVAQEPLIIRNALAVQKKLAEAPIALWPDQWIAGSVVLPDRDLHITGALPDYATQQEKEEAAKYGLSVGSIVGHIVPSYPRLLQKGTAGIKAEAATLSASAQEPDSLVFYRACSIVMDALAAFAARHAALCRRLAAQEQDGARKAELLSMADDLEYAPAHPAASFSQAVSAIWITHLAFQYTGNQLAIGRFDQHVWPYLQKDLEAGRQTLQSAAELVDCFMLKFNERSMHNQIRREKIDFEAARARNERAWAKRSPFAHSTQRTNERDNVDATNHWLQNVVVGGVLPEDGSDATNPVTYMCLDAFDKNRMTNPCLTVRLHADTPQELLIKSCEVLKNGGGLPAFFNDEAIIPALVRWGIDIRDARDYTNDGCWEVIIAGQNDFYFDRFNMLRCLEWTLNRGKSRIDEKEEAPDPGDPASFMDYGTVYQAFLATLYYELEGLMAKNHRQFGQRQMIAPVPLLSALLEGPMEMGGDMTRSGAKYVTYGLIAEGVSHVVDSLMAIKTVIFDRHEATMSQLVDALDKNFAGYEALRAQLMAAPKYGRNDREADRMGADLVKAFAQKTKELNACYDHMTFLPGAGTFSWYIAIGEGLGASPDGRLAGEPVSSNFSPSAGAATRGVTGALLSQAAFDMLDLPVGSPTDLRLSSRLVEGPEGTTRLVGLVKSFVSLGGNMLTLTIADTQMLRRAQQNPEQYRDLRVRMGGWSAYFTMLSQEQQEHHIQKQEEM